MHNIVKQKFSTYFKLAYTPITLVLTLIFTNVASAKTYEPGDIVGEFICQNEGSISMGHNFKRGLVTGEAKRLWDKGRLTINVAYDLYPNQSIIENKTDYDFKLRVFGDLNLASIYGRGLVTTTLEEMEDGAIVLTNIGGTSLNLYKNKDEYWQGVSIQVSEVPAKGYVKQVYTALTCWQPTGDEVKEKGELPVRKSK